ncbi:unnamed protein product [Anisakis simplex]|uniref:acid phosphatase n=1 Tax=Anisakis simplex TaxID=6269 RepID=A0A3P6RW01_ANISI|nr:unnamed protein product [Anisakis simplex]
MLCQISDQAPANQDQLHLVQVIWRDGDHVPARICKKDANHWPGQQWGQLTVTGMQQHHALGALLFKKYAIQAELLNTTYSSSELHIRTVDLNRTITSATSNALGMFYDDSNLVTGLDYPNNKDWPKGYLPIPVHMIEQQTDHVRSTAPNEVLSKSNEVLKSTEIVITKRTGQLSMLLSLDSECARRRYLINDVLRKSKQFTETEQKAQAFLDELSKICGEKVTLTDVPFLMNSYRIERSQGRMPLLSRERYQKLQPIENLLNNYMNGKGIEGIQDIDLSVELPKVRAGGLLWQILNRMDAKVKCLNSATDKKTKECKYLDKLKYYAYSVAGNMFDAFMATAHLETPSAQNRTSDASAILFEFWTTAEGVNAIKVFYVDCPTSDFKSLNPQICNGTAKDFCVLDEFKKKMQPYNPGDIDALCSQVPSSYQNTKSQSVRASEQEIQSLAIDKQQEELNSTAADAAGRKRELIFVHAAWRHGDRTPKSICPNDRDNQASTWRKGHGDTTVLGMQEQQQLGALIYNEYAVKNKFLSATYNSAELYVRAVDLNRTLTSAQSNLLGMYYNRPNQDNLYPHEAAWPKGYFPIPIHTVNMATDYVSSVMTTHQVSDPHAICARKNDLLALQWKTEKVTEFVKNNQEFLKEVSNVCGAPLTIKNISVAVDTMFVEKKLFRITALISSGIYAGAFYLDSVNETFHGYNLRVDLATIADQMFSIGEHQQNGMYVDPRP